MSSSDLKVCFKCGVAQPRTEFYKHSAMADGILGKCKSCTKKDSTKRRNDNIDAVRKYDRDRAKNPERARDSAAINKRWRQEDKRRTRCHNALIRAVRSGTIKKEPCCICGSENSLAHHEDYDFPLDVVWYCQPHHKERHKQMILEGKNYE